MPLFFFVSGIFSRDRNILSEISKCLKTLIVPYLFFVFFFSLYYFLFYYVLKGSFNEAFSMLFNEFDLLDESSYIYSAIWYLLCLMEIRIIFNICCRIRKRQSLVLWQMFIGILFFFCGYYLSLESVNLPFFIDTALSAYIFYSIGYVMNKTSVLSRIKENKSIVIVFLLVVLYSLAILIEEPNTHFARNVFPIYIPLLAMSIILALYCLSLYIEQTSYLSLMLQLIGKRSLSILGFHIPMFSFLFVIVRKMGVYQNVQFLFVFILSLGLSLLLDKYTSMYAPVLLGKK